MPDYADVLNETLPPLSGSSYIDKMLEARSTEPTKPAQGPSEADLKIGDYHRAFSQDAEKRWGPGSPAYVANRVPALGTVKAIDDVLRLREAAKAHQAGNPSDEDLQIIGHHLAKSEYEGSRTGVGQRALDLSTHLPGLIAEWAATGGAGGAGRVAATKLATRMGLKAAEGIGARALARGAIGAAGEALARTPLMPSTYGAIAANTVGQDEQGNIVPKSIPRAAFKGAASALVMNTLFSATGQWGLDRPAATTALGAVGSAAGGLGKAMGAMHGGQEINYQLGAVDSPSAVHEYLAKGDPAARNQLLAEIAVFGGMEAFLHAKATIKARAEKMRAVGLDPTAPANQAKIAADIEPLVKNPEASKEAQPATEPYIDLNKTEPHIQLPEEAPVEQPKAAEPPEPTRPLHDMTPEEMIAATSPVEKAPDEPPAAAPRLRAERVALARAAAGLPPEETPAAKGVEPDPTKVAWYKRQGLNDEAARARAIENEASVAALKAKNPSGAMLPAEKPVEPPAAPPETKAPVAETPSAPAQTLNPAQDEIGKHAYGWLNGRDHSWEDHPERAVNDEWIKQSSSRQPLPLPPGGEHLPGIKAAWDLASRLWPEAAAKVKRIEAEDHHNDYHAATDLEGTLFIPRGKVVDPYTLWHELTHIAQVDEGRYPNNPSREEHLFLEREAYAREGQMRKSGAFDKLVGLTPWDKKNGQEPAQRFWWQGVRENDVTDQGSHPKLDASSRAKEDARFKSLMAEAEKKGMDVDELSYHATVIEALSGTKASNDYIAEQIRTGTIKDPLVSDAKLPPEPPQAPASAPTAAERAMARKRQQSMGLKPVEDNAAAVMPDRPEETLPPPKAEAGPDPNSLGTPATRLDDFDRMVAAYNEGKPAKQQLNKQHVADTRQRIEDGSSEATFEGIAKARGVTKQAVKDAEKKILAKIGWEGTTETSSRAKDRLENKADLAMLGEDVEVTKAEAAEHEQGLSYRRRQADMHDQVLSEIADEIMKEKDNPVLTPKGKDYYAQRIAGADQEAARRIAKADEKYRQSLGSGKATPPAPAQADANQPRPAEPPPPAGADAQPGAGVEPQLPEGMGAAGGGSQAATPEPGTLGAKSPNVEEPPQTAATIKRGLLGRTADFFRSFAGQAFPALTRESQAAGEKLAARANSDKAAKSTWDYISQMVKVNGTPLADMTPEQHRFIGSVWLERRMREYRDFLNRSGQVSGNVRTLVGQEGSSLPTEADYQEGLRTLWPFFEAIKQEWTPIVDKNYRGLTGLEPDEMINARSQIPGLPLNAIALKAEDVGKPGVVSMGGRKQGFENQKIRNPGYTRKAELNAEAYDTDISHMMQRTLNTGIKASRTAEFMRASLADGVIKEVPRGEQAPEGYRHLGLDPARNLEGIDPKGEYYVHPNAFKDVVQGLGIGERPGQAVLDGLKTVSQPIYNIALMAPVELATHIANHFTALFKDGMKTPILNLQDSFVNAWGIWTKDPEMLRKSMNLANIAASFGHEVKPGLMESLAPKEFSDKWKHLDLTHWANRLTGGIIDTMQKAVRIQLSEAYDRVADAKGIEKSDTGRRDFINQAVGNYSGQANNRLTQLLKDSGLQAFATAAHTFTSQGVKTATLQGNLRGENLSNTAALIAVRAIKLMPVLAMGPVINYLQWGQSFPDDVPDFAIKTGDEGGKVKYFDPLTFTGLRRGAKVIGTNAIVSNMIHGDKTAGQVLDQARRESLLSLTHLFEGPPVQVAKMAATGEGYGGRKVAEQVSKASTPQGVARARALGKPEPGSSQTLLDLKAAALSVNPMVASFAGVDRPKTPRTFAENVGKMLGPFGVKDREKKLTPKERRAMGLK